MGCLKGVKHLGGMRIGAIVESERDGVRMGEAGMEYGPGLK
jgi:hypothetical protein